MDAIRSKTVITEEKEVVITPIEGKDTISIPIQYIPNGPNVSKRENQIDLTMLKPFNGQSILIWT